MMAKWMTDRPLANWPMFQQRLALVRYESGDGKTFDFVSVSLVSSVLLLEFFVWNNSESSIDCNSGPMFFHAPRFVGIMSCFSSYQQKHEKMPTIWCDPGPIFHAFRIIKSEQKHAIALSRNQLLKRPTSRLLRHMMNARQVSNGWIDFIQWTNFIGIFIRMSLKSTQ